MTGYGYGAPPQEDTTLAVLVHLSLFAFGLIGPLVAFLIVKDDPAKPFTRHHAAEALNFHLAVTIAAIVSFALLFVLIGFVLLPAVVIASWVLAILAAVAAGRREWYRYPVTIRFVR